MNEDDTVNEALELIAEIMTMQASHLTELKEKALDDLEELVR